MTFLYSEAASGSGVTMYNATTGAVEAAKAPVSLVLDVRVQRPADHSGADGEGPAAARVAQTTQREPGRGDARHLMVKWVIKVTFATQVVPWSVEDARRPQEARQTPDLHAGQGLV